MSAGVVISVGLAVLFLAAPVALLFWARSATMFSGRTVARYDGPHPLGDEDLSAGAEQREPPDAQLSAEEEAAWEELTKVSWNMPRQDG